MENIWFGELRNSPTRSLLELLGNLSEIPFVYRDISTREELKFHLGRWVGRNTYKKDYALGDYGILYLGFHGSAGEIYLREDLAEKTPEGGVNLEEIEKMLLDKEAVYDCSGAVIHFGSCSVLGAPRVWRSLGKGSALHASADSRSLLTPPCHGHSN